MKVFGMLKDRGKCCVENQRVPVRRVVKSRGDYSASDSRPAHFCRQPVDSSE